MASTNNNNEEREEETIGDELLSDISLDENLEKEIENLSQLKMYRNISYHE